MSHEIEIKNGQASMMYAGQVPWHGLGTAVEKEVTAAAAIKLAGLDWTCIKEPAFLRGIKEIDGIPVIGEQIPKVNAVVRTSDRKVMGTVGDGYEIIQNQDCFDFVDKMIGAGQAVYHTAGSLFGGRRIFLTVKLPSTSQVGPDKIDQYILLSSTHDGSQCMTIRWTPVRVVCNNTLQFAFHDSKQCVKVHHKANFKQYIKDCREALELSDAYYAELAKAGQKLLDAKFTEDQMREFVAELTPVETEKVSTRTKNKRDQLFNLFDNGIDHEAIRRTKWAAYNAVTQFIDHEAKFYSRTGSSKEEAKMNSIFYGGSGEEMKKKAFELLTA